MMNESFQLGSSDDDEDSMWLHPDDAEEIGINGSKEPVIRGWDQAIDRPPDDETQAAEDDVLYVFILKFFKVLTYIIAFCVLLIGTVISKMTLFLMTSQLQPKRFVRYCEGKTDHLEVGIPELERISWSWIITFAFMVPEVFVFLRSIRICVFKVVRLPTFPEFLIPLFFETCHVMGLSILVFVVLPSLDAVSGIMLTNAVCLIPAIFGIATRFNKVVTKPKNNLKMAPKQPNPTLEWYLVVIDTMAVVFLLVGLVLWPVFVKEPNGHTWFLPLACLLTSCGWWENYINFVKKKTKSEEDGADDQNKQPLFSPLQWLKEINFNSDSRYVTYLLLSMWKIGLFICGMMFGYWIQDHGDVERLFHGFNDAFNTHPLNVTEIRPPAINSSLPAGTLSMYDHYLLKFSEKNAPIYTMVAQILAGWVAYMTAKFACKIGIQKFSFSFPLTLTVPVTLAIVTSLCGMRTENECFWSSVFPNYLFWTCPKGTVMDFLWTNYGWVWILWIVAQVWITRHIWAPMFQRLERAEILFVSPMYSALLIDQSLALNRRRENRRTLRPNHDEDDDEDDDEEEEEGQNINGLNYQQVGYLDPHYDPASAYIDADSVPKIYACATMWHENKEEMIEILKSIFRMDEDQCARRVALKVFGVMDQDYYEFETHIFFDDAFVVDKSKDDWVKRPQYLLNKYVKDMLATVGKAAEHVHETDKIRLNPPKKIPTPYGGRLEWTLPGKTKLICHMKNKDKIRHKKRWSQVMYMYYLLGYKLLNQDIPSARKDMIAENTYLLALDGDIDFQPSAVQLLVDLMKKNKNLGAACGRIHPIGKPSLMVWYQMFEYAIGHWFQKATEHVIGCVLCSPGCFSLFRAKALLDDNVMARYTTESSEPVHFVQYDQGEDRWLCTLLLQRGYRVEYSAASDSKTHCPEGFGEFFNQRRRWVPSTMANIFDLLGDSKKTIRANPDISYPYILYQMMMMGGSILGPGSIFLMLIGAFNAAFRIDNYTAFLWNFIPILLFTLVCFFFDKDVQLIFAQILAAAYALVMVAVIVALMIQIQEDGPLAPSSLFFFGVAVSFIIAAILHPLEFNCLPYGVVYYITIPSMYLILIIYSLMNLHDVSWGTREVPVETTTAEQQKKAEEEKKEKSNTIFGFQLPKSKSNDSEGSFEFSCAGLFKLMCCTKPVVDEKIQLQKIADSLAYVGKRLDSLEHRGSINGDRRISITSNPRASSVEQQQPHSEAFPSRITEQIMEEDEEVEFKREEAAMIAEEKTKAEPVNDDIFPIWAEDPDLKHGTVDFLTGSEHTFWIELIAKYLTPIEKNEKVEKEIKGLLKDLRNKMIFFFLMVNAVFVLAIFLLQNNKDTIFIEWPLGAKWNMTYTPDTTEILVTKTTLSLEPIGVVFVFVFAVVIFIQFTAMLVHRCGTFMHIMASTVLEFCSRTTIDSNSDDSALQKNGVQIVKKMQKLKNLEDANVLAKNDKRKTSRSDVARRKTVQNLEKSHESGGGRKVFGTLDQVVEENFKAARNSVDRQTRFLGRPSSGADNNARVTFQALERRRTVVQNNRRASIENARRQSVENARRQTLAGNNVLSNNIMNSPSINLVPPTPVRTRPSSVGFTN